MGECEFLPRNIDDDERGIASDNAQKLPFAAVGS